MANLRQELAAPPASETSMGSQETLPPGFRFHPTDEELIVHYLRNRAASLPCPVSVVAEVDIYKFDPWELPAKTKYGDREWYFFSPRDRKYPNGVRPNRAAGSGYWKATGTDKVIVAAPGGKSIGVKKALVFYKGRPPKGAKTNWIMHEYRLAEDPAHARPLKPSRDSSMRLDDWVLCRIYKKSSNQPGSSSSDRDQEEYSNAEDAHLAPGTAGGAPWSDLKMPKSFSFSELLDDGDYSVLARLLCENPLDMAGPSCPELGPILGHANLSQATLMNPGGDGDALGLSLPQLAPMESPASAAGSCLKRRWTATGYDEEGGGAMTKKPNSSCTDYSSFGNQLGASPSPCNILNSPFLHPQILLNSHLGFH